MAEGWIRVKNARGLFDSEVAQAVAGYLEVRIAERTCATCSVAFRVPTGGRSASARPRRFGIHARRCIEHRRPYERPPATPGVIDSRRAAVYQWEDRLVRDFHEEFDWKPLHGALKAQALSMAQLIEHAEAAGLGLVKDQLKPLSSAECRSYVRFVWGRLYPADAFGHPYLRIDRGRTRTSVADAEHIRLAPAMRNRATLLHEITHAYLARVLENGTYADHGPEFAAVYARLLSRHLGLSEEHARNMGNEIRPRRVVFSSLSRLEAILNLGR